MAKVVRRQATTIPARLRSSLPHPSSSPNCWTIWSRSATTTIYLESPRRRSPMHSSRPSTHSSMATAAPAVSSSTSCCVGAAWQPG